MIENKKFFGSTTYVILICAIVYKLVLECGFWSILKARYYFDVTYNFEFNIIKYIAGFLWVLLLFFMIRHDEKRPSTFFLQLQYFISIIPITIIYSFSNENTLYYITICTSFAVAEIIVFITSNCELKNYKIFKLLDKKFFTRLVVYTLYLITIIVYIGIVAKNGLFTLEALNIYNVYEVRAQFSLNKYIGYLFSWQYTVINPFFTIVFLKRNKKIKAFIFILLQFLAYLYAAQKTILFIIPLILIIYFFAKIKHFSSIVYSGLTILVVFSVALCNKIGLLSTAFDLFIRRVLFVPANLKFIYYDFFSNNAHIGFAGTLIGKFLNIEFPYEGSLGKIISSVYFNKPDMNSNTGFLAEGYYRFGLFGCIIALVIFALLLLIIDRFSEKNGFELAISICLFSIFLLNDGELIDPLIFGNLTLLVIILVLYNDKHYKPIKLKDRRFIKRGQK